MLTKDQTIDEKRYNLCRKLAGQGFIPCAPTGDTQKPQSRVPTLLEFWRIDKPSVRAYYGIDKNNNHEMVVHFEKQPEKAGGLRGIFSTPKAEYQELSVDDIVNGAHLPFSRDISFAHARLASHLQRPESPMFVVMPAFSNDQEVTLYGVAGLQHDKSYRHKDLGDVMKKAMEYNQPYYRVQLDVSTNAEELQMQVFDLKRKFTVSQESMNFSQFTSRFKHDVNKYVSPSKSKGNSFHI